MRKYPARTVQILSRSGKVLFFTFAAGIGAHFLVMLLEAYLVKSPFMLNFDNDFLGTAFSTPMIPVICAYGIFAVLTYYLWSKMKRALLEAQEIELRAQKEKIVLESTQRLVGVLASHITLHNAEILRWVEYRKSQNKQIPESVERSSRNIASVLETLTEAAFIAPYTKNEDGSEPRTIEAIDAALRKRLVMTEPDTDYV
jgi:hypothetical protein